jgi:hypothetical protein
MRFSAVFEPRMPMRAAQAEERAAQQEAKTELPAPPLQELPDDLDQRVRQIGEWQLEDW